MAAEAIDGADEGVQPGDEGIDGPRLEEWFAGNVPDAEPPLHFERISGGRSNLTYSVRDAGGRHWALRRPPLGKRLTSAHDMSREHRIISALQGTDVPVPPVVGLCEDDSVNGAPFYVMDFVDGPILRSRTDAEKRFDENERRAIGERVVDTLVAIHAVDPNTVGLGELGRKQDYVARQLHRWQGQWEKSKTRELPVVDDVHDRLAARIPEQGQATIVHGDYRLDNMILTDSGEIAAVVDWELCTLGDPLADIGMLIVYWSEQGDELMPLFEAPTIAPGFPTREQIRERYAERSGRDLSEIDFYVALGSWRLAIILQGVYARFAAGQYGKPDAGVEEFAGLVERLADAADAAERRLG
jgi:aminoglycoside phosphotransferase (APT) family kinase protein